jgi:hypothetical protein
LMIRKGCSCRLEEYLAGGDPTEDLREFRRKAGQAHVQTFDISAVAGRTHVLFCLMQSLDLEATGQLLADRVEVDLLQRVAGTNQISEAVRRAGSKEGAPSLLVIFGAPADVRRAYWAISKQRKLRSYGGNAPERPLYRVDELRRRSVVGMADPDPLLLVEDAALLRR